MVPGRTDRRSESRNYVKNELEDKVVDIEKIKWQMFEVVYRSYENEVYKVCLHFAKDEHIAKDMTHKTFFSFYNHFEKVDPEKTRAYLLRTAKNMTMNFLRDFKRLKDGWIEDLNDEDLKILSVEEVYVRSQDTKYATELSNSILEALYNKNKRWYDLVVMAYYLDIPQDDIAESLGVDVDVVYSRLYRAKQWIRKTYKEEYEHYLKMVTW